MGVKSQFDYPFRRSAVGLVSLKYCGSVMMLMGAEKYEKKSLTLNFALSLQLDIEVC